VRAAKTAPAKENPLSSAATRTAPKLAPSPALKPRLVLKPKVVAQHDDTRRDELILDHLPLVTAIAVRVHENLPVHVELDDLIHAGVMGLFEAATKYDANKMVAFPAYAKHRIKGAILDSLRQLDWASRDLRRRHKQMEQVTLELTTRLSRAPTPVEIAGEMGMSLNRWKTLMIDLRNLGLLAAQSRTNNDLDERPAQDLPCACEQHPDRLFARTELRSKLSSAIKTLPERYRQVVTLYYDRDLTMKEIGTILGVNESRISQIHKAALERMQNALSSSGIHSSGVF
jgi:RNA polymerase sigma factor for flagellar operon FliA